MALKLKLTTSEVVAGYEIVKELPQLLTDI